MLTSPEQSRPQALPQAFLEASIRRLMPGWQNALEDFVYLEGGYANANYRFRHGNQAYVLRTPAQPDALTESPPAPTSTAVLGVTAEVTLRSQLGSSPALVIAPLVAADLAYGQMITGYVPGPVLAEQPPSAQQACRYLQHLHQQLRKLPQQQSYDLAGLIHGWMPEPPNWLASYLRRGSDLQTLAAQPQQCCHNDLNPWNVVVSAEQPDAWTTLDWETAQQGHPVFDAVCLHQGLALELVDASKPSPLDQPRPGWPGLAEFCAQALGEPVASALLQAAVRCFWLREYAWAQDQLRLGNDNPAIAAQRVQAEQQLRLHLDA